MKLRTAGIIYSVIEVIFDIIVILLAIRILFRFFGANPGTPIVDWLYDTTSQLMAPFIGIFPSPTLEGFFMLDIPAVIALVVYSVVGYVLLNFLMDLRLRAEKRK